MTDIDKMKIEASEGHIESHNEGCIYEINGDAQTTECEEYNPRDSSNCEFLTRNNIPGKLMYMLSVSGVILLTMSVISAPWFIPYVYTIITPILILIRCFQYWRLKYQYFLLDFCYFGNAFIYVYIWAFPDKEKVFLIAYAIATGPLLWSMLVFRNSLVFHSLDKMTSTYIHILAPLLLFAIRWYPDHTSKLWYTPFYHANAEELSTPIWLVFIPFSFPVIHQILYGVFVYGIMQPSDDYLYTFNYLVGDETTKFYKICTVFGKRFRHVVFGSVWLLIILGMLSLTLIWFNSFIGNCAIIIFFILVIIYNGGTYTVDVYGSSN